MKQVVKGLQIIGMQPVSSSGCRITAVSVAWDHVAKVRLLLLRPNFRELNTKYLRGGKADAGVSDTSFSRFESGRGYQFVRVAELA